MSNLFFQYKRNLRSILILYFLPISLWASPKDTLNIFLTKEIASTQAIILEDSLKIKQLELEAKRFKKDKKWQKFIDCHMEVASLYLQVNNSLAQHHIDSAIIYNALFIENSSEKLAETYIRKAFYLEDKAPKKALSYYNKLELILKIQTEKESAYQEIYEKQLTLYQQLNDHTGIIQTCQKITNNYKHFAGKNKKILANNYFLLGKSEVAIDNSHNALLAFHNYLVTSIESYQEENLYKTPDLSIVLDTTISVQLLNALNYKGFLLHQEFESSQNLTALKAAFDHYLLLTRLMDQFRLKLGDLHSNALLVFYQNNKSIYENAIKICLKLRKITGNKEYHENAYEIIQRSKGFGLKTSLPSFKRKQSESNLVASIASIQETLDRKDLLIDYLFTEKTLYITTISKDTFFLKPVNTALELQIDHINNFLGLLKPKFPSDEIIHPFSKKAHQLYQLLVQPSIASIDASVQTLIINPDGLLHYISFEALVSEESTAKEYKKLPYLVKKYAVKYIYSSSLLTKQKPRTPKDILLSKVAIFAPFTSLSENETIPEEGILRTFKNIDIDRLNEGLEGGEKEKEVLEKISDGVYFSGRKASKKKFLENAPQFNLIHATTHGVSDDSLLNNSFLVFNDSVLVTALKKGDSNYLKSDEFKKNNLLYGHEISQLSLKADLVVLSACESGLGKNIQGEGIFSPGRSFIHAGAPNVIMTLWAVNDHYSAELMELFYQQLDQNLSYEKALQEAKIQFFEMVTHRNIAAHPLHWAGYVKIGLY